MKSRILSVVVFLVALFSLPAISADGDVEAGTKYAEITQGQVVVRQSVDGNSPMVALVKRGGVYEITQEGSPWMQISTPEGKGWIPITHCRIMDGLPNGSGSGHTIAFIAVIVLGLIITIVFFVRRKEDEDIF